MTKIYLTCNGGNAEATVDGILTEKMVGVKIILSLGADWDGLSPRLIAMGGGLQVTCLLDNNEATLPWECLRAGSVLKLGVEGWSDDGSVVIPTEWAKCDTVIQSASQTQNPPPSPTEIMAITTMAKRAQDAANSIREDANNGLFDGHSPYIGEDKEWYEWDENQKDYVNTGIYAGLEKDQMQRIDEAVDAAVQAVDNEGARVKATIPADYSALSEDVEHLGVETANIKGKFEHGQLFDKLNGVIYGIALDKSLTRFTAYDKGVLFYTRIDGNVGDDFRFKVFDMIYTGGPASNISVFTCDDIPTVGNAVLESTSSNDYIDRNGFMGYYTLTVPAKYFGVRLQFSEDISAAQTVADNMWIGRNKYASQYVPYLLSVQESVEKEIQNPLLCVSTYRAEYTTGLNDYQYAVSWDGGKTFVEIRDSLAFGGGLEIGTDVYSCEFQNDLLALATKYSPSSNTDFRAVYTSDFVNYKYVDVDIGFMRKSNELAGKEARVWAPQLAKIGDDYYIAASVCVSSTRDPDPYGFNEGYVPFNIYAVKVDISVGETLTVTPVGELFKVRFRSFDSTMDASFSESNGNVYCIYKRRGYNTVHIAKARAITDEFVDVVNYVGEMPYSEAGYLLKAEDNITAFWCQYTNGYTQRAFFNATTGKLSAPEYVGCINPHNVRSDGTDPGMRNPYPFVLKGELLNKFLAVYKAMPPNASYELRRRISASTNISLMSNVLYNTYGWYTRYPEKAIMPRIADNLDVYFRNQPIIATVEANKTVHINDGKGEFTVNTDDEAGVAVVSGGKGILLADTSVSSIHVKGRLEAGTDLNTVTGNAEYMLSANSGYANCPITIPGVLRSYRFDSKVFRQQVEPLNGASRYSRYTLNAGETWNDWRQNW